jgi:hypothetical protein
MLQEGMSGDFRDVEASRWQWVYEHTGKELTKGPVGTHTVTLATSGCTLPAANPFRTPLLNLMIHFEREGVSLRQEKVELGEKRW